jgi:acyl carrier protein
LYRVQRVYTLQFQLATFAGCLVSDDFRRATDCGITKALLLNDGQITPDAHLIHDLGVTSLDRFELVMGIEDEFSIVLTNEEQETIHTVGDVIELARFPCASSPAPVPTGCHLSFP